MDQPLKGSFEPSSVCLSDRLSGHNSSRTSHHNHRKSKEARFLKEQKSQRIYGPSKILRERKTKKDKKEEEIK